MVSYRLIDKKLIVSPTARQFYRVCSVLGLITPFGLTAVKLFGVPEIIAPMLRPIVFLGALSVAAGQIGMEIFLFRFDNSHPLKQMFWFCVLLVPFFGVALYCFVVYSRSDAVRNSDNPPES